jgi:uncharacterized Zn finger protein
MARLLAGELPEEVEEVFSGAGVSLFPHKSRAMETDCSCPDWSNPCKHTTAVFYLLAEEFDRDPFLLFKLRGLSREELFKLLGYGVPQAPALQTQSLNGVTGLASEELPLESSSFWGGEELPDDLFGEVSLPDTPAALPRRLGNFPF